MTEPEQPRPAPPTGRTTEEGARRPGSRAAGRVVAGPVRAAQRGSEAHRLEPRVAFDGEGELLGDLALEQVDLRAAGRERPESAVGDGGGRHAEPGLPVVGEHDVEADAVVRRTLGHAEQGRDAITGLDGVEDRAPEVGRRQLGDGVAVEGATVPHGGKGHGGLHGRTSRKRTASRSRVSSGAGM